MNHMSDKETPAAEQSVSDPQICEPQNMQNMKTHQVYADTGLTSDPWKRLTSLTDARIALGRVGVSTPTKAQLAFNLDHALARDAVNLPLNTEQLCSELHARQLPYIRARSQASDRRTYLQRPDLGRRLNSESVNTLQQHALNNHALTTQAQTTQAQSTQAQTTQAQTTQAQTTQAQSSQSGVELAIVLVDGLSSTAVQQNGVNLCAELYQQCVNTGLRVSPIVLVEQGRVAIGDEIGAALNAQSVALIVGERPGLSSPDSLGIYYTYHPEPGLTDARRNCISNVRAAGLSNDQAISRLMWLLNESRTLGTSGVSLKDNSTVAGLNGEDATNPGNFLLPES